MIVSENRPYCEFCNGLIYPGMGRWVGNRLSCPQCEMTLRSTLGPKRMSGPLPSTFFERFVFCIKWIVAFVAAYLCLALIVGGVVLVFALLFGLAFMHR